MEKNNPTVDPTHVAMAVCPICGETSGVILSTEIENGHLKKVFTRKYYVDPTIVCPACREKYLTDGILLINPESCNLAVLKLSAYERIFPGQVITDDHIVFADEALIETLMKMGAIQNASEN